VNRLERLDHVDHRATDGVVPVAVYNALVDAVNALAGVLEVVADRLDELDARLERLAGDLAARLDELEAAP
jgi:hypothetical protein